MDGILETPQYREFADAPALRQHIFDNVLGAAQSLAPISNTQHTLELKDAAYEGPDRFSAAEEKRAVLEGRSLDRRLRGTWLFRDNATGKPLDERRTTIAHVPYMTDRGTFVQRGIDYSIASQLRLRPGIFARTKESGELESHANVAGGLGHRYFLDPESGVFHLNIGQAKLPLISLLRTLGATDEQVQEAWGRDLWQANVVKDDPRAIDKLHARIFKTRPYSGTKQEAVAAAFRNMRLDPEVTSRTLGKPFEQMSAEAVLMATKKLLAVSRGEEEPDDRDHLAYQTLLGPEDLLAERIAKDSGGVRRKLLWRASHRGNLTGMPAGALTQQLRAVLLHSGLANPIEDASPLDVRGQLVRVTRMGEGGLSSVDSIPDESRSVQPSHLNFIDPIFTVESLAAGIDLRLAGNAVKGKNGLIYSKFISPKTGETVLRTPQQVGEAVIAFPGELDGKEPYVTAMVGGKIRYVSRDKVDLVPASMENSFSLLGNLVPMKSSIKGQRLAMGSRMATQALPLLERESPLVQSAIPGTDETRSYEEEYGKHAGAVFSAHDGTVKSVTRDEIVLKTADGEVRHDLHSNRPLNRKTPLDNTAAVRPGDRIKAGGLLATSNYTDASGTMAIGRNARVAYLPARGGGTHEDAVTISESFAEKLRSDHMFQHDVEWEDGQKRGKNSFVSLFPGKFDRKQLENIDTDGIVQPGTTLNYGDPLILLAAQKQPAYNQVHRPHSPSFTNSAVTWEHRSPGVVTDVAKTSKGAVVAVRSSSPAEIADKVSGRFGDKGVIGKIIPDDQMLQDAQGRPFDMLLTPMGIPTRGNPAQAIEAALGKIAAHRGQPYKVEDWRGRDINEFARTELAKYGLKDTEDVVDPETGRKVKDVLTGSRFMMKLVHQAEGKSQGRAVGSYSSEGIPAKGFNEDSSKRVGMLDLNALAAHAVPAVLRDIKLIRGQRNDDYWLTLMRGQTPPTPRVPLVYEKFIAGLEASGIQPIRRGDKIQIVPTTNKHVDELVGDRNLSSADLVHWKEGMKEVSGGLFDKALTGGHFGKNWSGLVLHESMPSPAQEEPIRRLLGLTEKQFRDTLSGQQELRGLRGPAAIGAALGRINVPDAIADARAAIRGTKKGARDTAVRRLAYLEAADRTGIHPRDWMLKRIPVLPPIFRPVSAMSRTGTRLVADPNILYKELFDANSVLKDLSSKVDDVSNERLSVYDSIKAVAGLGDPVVAKSQATGVRGILKELLGPGGPKTGTYHRRILGSSVDLVGRAVIAPDDRLGMDEVGLPEDKAWTVYRPFIVRRLVRRGMPAFQAIKAVQDRRPEAKEELLGEMRQRPVLINRAPTWHRYGFMAAYPKLAAGNALKVPPLWLIGAGGDFDGDQANYQVPASDDAVKEAIEKMLPSKNLLSAKNFRVFQIPRHEYLIGNWIASSRVDKKGPTHRFDSTAAAIQAYKRGELNVDSRVEIG